MSLAIDSLVTDLIFQSGDALDPEILVETLGGQEELAKKQVVDPDMQDPRFEMELSPSMPFRRRDERRLMIIDDSVAPMRKDPREDTLISLDLREARAHLIDICSKTPVRLGRLFALGSWGDAVWVVRSLRDLRSICLLGWVLDPSIDIDGRRRATPLGQAEFEEKLLAYDKRLDELDDDSIRETLGEANVEELDDLIIVDVLEEDGSWDTTKSLELEARIAAVERFSAFVGARSIGQAVATSPPPAQEAGTIEDEVDTDTGLPALEPVVEPLKTVRLGDSLLLVFPAQRFDLEVAAHLGKKDWSAILRNEDNLEGADKDHLYEHGADFVAGVEFLSEVFVEGKPLGKAEFESGATTSDAGLKTMEVHFPRFGPVMLISRPDGSRFVTSRLNGAEEIVGAL
jgi:hypothetical protein